MRLSISNISTVLDLTDERVLIRCGKRKIEIIGENITFEIFENGTCEMSGKVNTVRFDQ